MQSLIWRETLRLLRNHHAVARLRPVPTAPARLTRHSAVPQLPTLTRHRLFCRLLQMSFAARPACAARSSPHLLSAFALRIRSPVLNSLPSGAQRGTLPGNAHKGFRLTPQPSHQNHLTSEAPEKNPPQAEWTGTAQNCTTSRERIWLNMTGVPAADKAAVAARSPPSSREWLN